jgi:Subtilisin inhibitor-like
MRALIALLLLALAGCADPAGSGSDAGATTSASTSADAQADNDLLIVLDRGDGTEPQRYTLTCVGVPEGDHPDASAACAHLEGTEDPFAPLPTDMACTEQYGGPETARITGRWEAKDVDVELSRTDGCRISQWDSLGPVLPPVEGAVPN